MSHNKPTQEELDAGIKNTLEQEEKLKDQPEPPEETEDETTDPPADEDQDEAEDPAKEETKTEEEDDGEDEADEEKPEKKVITPTKEETPKDDEKKDPDWKTKHKESTREAMVLHAKNKKIQEAITNSADIPAPSDEEMETKFSNWEDMTSTEQSLARDLEHVKRQNAAINSAAQEGKNIDEWNTNVDKYLDDPHTLIDNPELEGKQDEFKIFAMKPTRRGLDFEDLVLAFNGERAKMVKPKQKGSMFETGTGGSKEKMKPTDTKLTAEEGNKLMLSDYKEFKRQLKAGNIKSFDQA